MDTETHEQMVARVGANKAPRITPDDIEAKIVGETFFRPAGTLTICVLDLANGFTVTGESACASPENFNEEIGNKIARKMAVDKVWALEGYLLREELHRAGAVVIPCPDDMRQYVGTKVINAKPMTRGEYNTLRRWDIPADEDPNEAGYFVQYTDRIDPKPNVPGYHGYCSWSPKDVFEAAYR